MVLAVSGCAPRAASVAIVPPRQSVVMLSGQSIELGTLVNGRASLLSLWAPWCEACVKEVDALNRLAAKTAGRGDAAIIGVAVGESRASVDRFVRDHDVRYAQVIDENFRLADALGQRDVPATLVVNREGLIVYRGEALEARGLAAFRSLLGEAR
jgi:thiol-disulfide isomerase/thioredoxin